MERELTAPPIPVNLPPMIAKPTTVLLIAAIAAGLAGCSTWSGLTTSSISGSDKAAALPPGPVAIADPNKRAVRIAEISARAEKCGFYFDAARLRNAYLASEAGQGLDAATLDKVTKNYDLSRQVTWKALASDDDYCSGSRTSQIKTALSKVLANDFTVYEEAKKDSSLLSSLMSDTPTKEVLNPNWGQMPREGITTKKPVE